MGNHRENLNGKERRHKSWFPREITGNWVLKQKRKVARHGLSHTQRVKSETNSMKKATSGLAFQLSGCGESISP